MAAAIANDTLAQAREHGESDDSEISAHFSGMNAESDQKMLVELLDTESDDFEEATDADIDGMMPPLELPVEALMENNDLNGYATEGMMPPFEEGDSDRDRGEGAIPLMDSRAAEAAGRQHTEI